MILDLFAGPGGWDEGLRMLGNTEPVLGIDNDLYACKSAMQAGHARLHNDVRTVDTRLFAPVSGLIASPPCQTFSLAGRMAGRAGLPDLANALEWVRDGFTPAEAASAAGIVTADARSGLVLEPMRFIRDLKPLWIAMENVPGVLKVFEAYASLLDPIYSTWAGILTASDYGVPQKRKRAFLLASRVNPVVVPQATHQEKPGGPLPQWITMADALELGEEPEDKTSWAWHRPATTVVRTYSPEVIAAPGYRRKGDPPRQRTPGSITVTPDQLMTLQGVRTDYPFAAAKPTRLGSLIGAMLPPPWAAAILRQFIGRACAACGNDDPTEGYALCMDCLEAGEEA